MAAGRAARMLLGCEAAAARAGSPAATSCVAGAETALADAYARAEARGGCAPDDGLARAEATVGDLVGELVRRLRPTPDGSRCQAGKLRAAGARTRLALRAHGRNLRRFATPMLVAGIAGAEDTYAARFARAAGGADCTTSGDEVAVGGATDAGLDNVMAALRVVVRSTVALPSPVAPANTPGSPGVTVTNPKLLAQFGGASFSLNNVTYTRWRLGGPAQTPDAVLVTVPGFGGGAGNFEPLAENLITRALEEHGLVVEVWGYDRRTEQLEDREGLLIAGALGDPLVGLDWYYGTELGLALSPALVAGPNRRAVFYNTSDDVPFLASWTSLVFSRDIDVVVEAARAAAGNVFLAGHSAGTGFAARYAATDFNLTAGPADPGYAKLRGVVLFEGGGGSAGTPLSEDALDRIEARFDGGLYAAVRDQVARCVDGVTACTVATEAADCAALPSTKCTPPMGAHGVILGISPKVLASAEPTGIQGLTDPDGGQAIPQVDQGAPGNNAVAKVPELALLNILAPGTVDGLFGSFLDDDGLTASISPAVAASMGGPGPTVGGLVTWRDLSERASFPACPGTGCLTPDNGPPPTVPPGGMWGLERECVRIDRLRSAFAGVEGANSSDWYYPISGLAVTQAPGVCAAGTCIAGNVGASCTTNGACTQSISLDSTQLSVGRGRRDIENLTQVANVDIPVLGIGGSNGLVPVPRGFLAVAQSLGVCAAPSCSGTPRVVDPALPSATFPTFGGVAGGFEVVIAEGFAHIDVVSAEDDAENPVVAALSAFIARNVQ
jgi:pimeloyl-ACP methyl ester carboxylesterase